MKKFRNAAAIALFAIGVVCLTGCNGKPSNIETKEAFAQLESDLKSKFGETSYYVRLDIINNEDAIGGSVIVEVTSDPASYKLQNWSRWRARWSRNNNITLELSSGAPEDYMLSLSELNLSRLGELVEASKKKLTENKGVSNPTVLMVNIETPNDDSKLASQYYIVLKDTNKGNTFGFYYNLQGELVDSDLKL